LGEQLFDWFLNKQTHYSKVRWFLNSPKSKKNNEFGY